MRFKKNRFNSITTKSCQFFTQFSWSANSPRNEFWCNCHLLSKFYPKLISDKNLIQVSYDEFDWFRAQIWSISKMNLDANVKFGLVLPKFAYFFLFLWFWWNRIILQESMCVFLFCNLLGTTLRLILTLHTRIEGSVL